ncbi:N-acetyltransferase [uncultured Acetobacteroides sp.]|uniref:N-acetyltransferase n=1 Tax=uncultured Acetobacteroides sp. TaxID=1760811 RepID=UPI0029F509BE|nr:N-acetyltransferase [uncultured Acetobacteroides sp.]
MERIVALDRSNIDSEHICCAFSDKKCREGYVLKQEWLKQEFGNGYVFRRIDARAKVFIEYGPAEKAWVPVDAPGYLHVGCFWVSGQYKGRGYGKELLRLALDDAQSQGKNGLVTVAGTSKLPFMSDTKWLLRQGFEICDKTSTGIALLVRKLNPEAPNPQLKDATRSGRCSNTEGLVAYYTNRCPFTEFHVRTSLVEAAEKRNLPLTIVKLDSMEQAQAAPSPATIFSLFYNGELVTTDLSVCLDSRFDKVINK